MSRGKKPKRSSETLPVAQPKVDYDDMTPKFCLAHIQQGFDVPSLPDDRARGSFASALQVRCTKKWRELKSERRHGLGFELMPKNQLRAPIPERFQDQERFMVFRYCGLLPMAGVRILDTFHVLWLEPKFGELYDHG